MSLALATGRRVYQRTKVNRKAPGRDESRKRQRVMDIVAWLGWAILAILGAFWSIVWFLISGWVSTLLQIALLVAAIYFLKYGWQRAPAEIWRRANLVAHFFWGWVRAREPHTSRGIEVREVVRVVNTKEFGDINVSTLLSLLTLVGLAFLTTL